MILAFLALAAMQPPTMPSTPDPMPPAQPSETAPVPDAVVQRYRQCTELVRSDAERAIALASAWRIDGGGVYARQCLGLAYVALERWAPAAETFEGAARDAAATGDPRQSDFWVQSGNAWVAAAEPARAVTAFAAALSAPGLTDELKGEVHLDRARALVALDDTAGARRDLDEALRLVPSDPMAWYLSAAFARRQNDLPRARTDVARAQNLAADNPDILLLAGTIAGQSGNMEEAERLYRRVAEGAPETEAGRQARESLATLREVEVDAPAGTQAQPAPRPSTPQLR